jgi:hypothetical protein
MNTTENLIATGSTATAPQPINQVIKPVKFPAQPQEWKIVSLRECPTPDTMQQCETPDQAAAYWKSHIATHPYFNSECECLVVFILNTRRRIKGHYLVSIGTMDTILCHPSEVFRLAIMASAAAIIIAHNQQNLTQRHFARTCLVPDVAALPREVFEFGDGEALAACPTQRLLPQLTFQHDRVAVEQMFLGPLHGLAYGHAAFIGCVLRGLPEEAAEDFPLLSR